MIDGGTFLTRVAFWVVPPAGQNSQLTIQGPVEFLPLPPEITNSFQVELEMYFVIAPLHGNIDHLFYDSPVILNYGTHVNRRVTLPSKRLTACRFQPRSATCQRSTSV